jgi:hypothetical protein
VVTCLVLVSSYESDVTTSETVERRFQRELTKCCPKLAFGAVRVRIPQEFRVFRTQLSLDLTILRV